MDVIQRSIQGVGEILAKILGKDTYNKNEIIFEGDEAKGAYDLDVLLNLMIGRGEVGDAEDFLFEEIEKHPTRATYYTGISILERLKVMRDEDLEKAGYSRGEIEAWEKDWRNYEWILNKGNSELPK